MKPFLKSLAFAFASRYSDLSGHLFVFPGRRAGTFFKKYLREAFGSRVAVLPSVTTMSDFVEDVSGRVVANRIEMLFMLYEAYTDYLKEQNVEEIPTFDSFRRWGETAVSDFNEVDMHCIDTDAIFKNVRDIKEISSNFLTDEQRRVMEEYFGVAYDPESVSTEFWKSYINHEDDELHRKFRLIWQVMAPLYHKLNEKLESKGMVSSGGAYRLAPERIESGKLAARKVVMVGFNALTLSEQKIFDALADGPVFTGPYGVEPFADFFWDATGPVLSDSRTTASRYVSAGIRRYPAPKWAMNALQESDTCVMPESIKVISVPSNSAQAKVVGEVLAEMKTGMAVDELKDARVAVVLPDESLLIPLLYSIPDGMGDINLTMGYPMKLTPTVSFVSLLRRIQRSRKKTGGVWGYYYKDLNLLLSHPFCHTLFRSSGVSKMKEWIKQHHRAIVVPSDLSEACDSFEHIFTVLEDDSNPRQVVKWLGGILEKISEALAEAGGLIKNKIDRANLETYLQDLRQMLDITEEYGLDMKWPTFLSLADRLIAGETVNFEGEPLRGLQIMGILETRALDFDRIIIPSLNERILPARSRAKTFISDSLRKAYGLPPVSYSESIFAYYFYRMISRAKEVVLLYDSRTSDGARNGDVSRYVLQLQYLHARNSLKRESRNFVLAKSDSAPSRIEKSEPVVHILEAFIADDENARNLSATALTKYAACNLKFYFEEVLRIRTDDTSSEYIDPITQGKIVHDVMQRIYLPDDMQKRYLTSPVEITSGFIKSRISDRHLIDTLLKRAINREHFNRPKEREDDELQGSSAYVAKALHNQIDAILRFDMKLSPFLLYGVEIDGNVKLMMPDGKKVNMRFAIDRLDKVEMNVVGQNREMLRIVDYKTGFPHVVADEFESIFSGDYKAANILQLLLYANVFDALPDKTIIKKEGERPLLKLFDSATTRQPSQGMCLEIYDVAAMNFDKRVFPNVENVEYHDNSELNAPFLSRLKEMLEEIFNPDIPFMPTSDPATCDRCQFKAVCFRE